MFGQSYLHRLLIGLLKLPCGVSPEALNPNGLNLYWHMSIRHRLSEWEFKLGFSRASQPWKLKSWVVVAIKYSWTAVIAQGWFFYNCTFISVISSGAERTLPTSRWSSCWTTSPRQWKLSKEACPSCRSLPKPSPWGDIWCVPACDLREKCGFIL